MISSAPLRSLSVLCASAVNNGFKHTHRRDAEHAKDAENFLSTVTHLTFRFVWFAKLLIHGFSLLSSAFKAIRRVDQKVRELLLFFL